MEECLICCGSEGKLVTLTDRGKVSLKEFAILRNDERVVNQLGKNENHCVHEECRKWFNNRKRILSSTPSQDDSKVSKTETRTTSA